MNAPTHHPDPQTLAAYRSGPMPVAERLAVSDHLAGCAACREALARTAGADERRREAMLAELPPLPPESAPGYEEMAALLDGTLDEAQAARVRAGLAAYPEVAAEFADLEHFRDEAAALPPRLHGPGPEAREPAAALAGSDRIVTPANWRWTRWRALAAAAAVLLAAGWWVSGPRKLPRADAPLPVAADVAALPADLRRAVEQAARTGTLAAAPVPASLRPVPGTLAGGPSEPGSLRQLAPVGQIVRGTRPALRWTPRDGASGYTVYLAAVGRDELVHQQGVPAGETEWTPPTELKRGQMYEWQIEADGDGKVIDRAPRPPAPEARFLILDEARAAELDQVERRFARDPLVLGTAYAQAGLWDEAVRQFEKLAGQRPVSPVAGKLLQCARAARGLR